MHQGVSRRPVLRFTNNLVQMYTQKLKRVRRQNIGSQEVTKFEQKIKTIIKRS